MELSPVSWALAPGVACRAPVAGLASGGPGAPPDPSSRTWARAGRTGARTGSRGPGGRPAGGLRVGPPGGRGRSCPGAPSLRSLAGPILGCLGGGGGQHGGGEAGELRGGRQGEARGGKGWGKLELKPRGSLFKVKAGLFVSLQSKCKTILVSPTRKLKWWRIKSVNYVKLSGRIETSK